MMPARPKVGGGRRRNIPERTKILLAVAAGGRCEFDGCNRYLFEHPLTLRGGNYSEYAHIFPVGLSGPRASEGQPPEEINDAGNLMLLCAPCHKQVDDHPETFTREVLIRYKQTHEQRIRHVTGLGPDMQTTIVQLKARIGGQAVDIPAADVFAAVLPRYPSDARGHVIDLTDLQDSEADAYWEMAKAQISTDVARIYERGMSVETTRHVSLFALASIPLLVHLGRCLSNKVAVDFFQRHRTGQHPWVWQAKGDPAEFEWELLRRGEEGREIGVILSVSGTVTQDSLPDDIAQDAWLYELRPRGRAPALDILHQRADLERFRFAYRELLSHIRTAHRAENLHLFAAAPAPVAVACGYDLLPKVDPTLIVYDNVRASEGFVRRLTVNDHD